MFDEKEKKTDIALVMKWKKGDRAAAEELLHRYQPLILALTKRAHPREEFDDVKQTLILGFLEKAKTFNPHGTMSFAGFIATRLQWCIKNEYNKAACRTVHEELTLENQKEPMTTDTYTNDSSLPYKEIAEIIHLTRKQAEVFRMWMEGKTTKEIMKVMGLHRSSLIRMKSNIQEKLRDHKEQVLELVFD